MINKTAIITSIKDSEITLKISGCSACNGCSVKNYCSLNENNVKEIKIFTLNASEYHIGETVNISMNTYQGFTAVMFGYLIPLILLVTSIITLHFFEYGEVISGISGIIILIPYYFGLFLARDRLKSDFRFEISKKDAI